MRNRTLYRPVPNHPVIARTASIRAVRSYKVGIISEGVINPVESQPSSSGLLRASFRYASLRARNDEVVEEGKP